MELRFREMIQKKRKACRRLLQDLSEDVKRATKERRKGKVMKSEEERYLTILGKGKRFLRWRIVSGSGRKKFFTYEEYEWRTNEGKRGGEKCRGYFNYLLNFGIIWKLS